MKTIPVRFGLAAVSLYCSLSLCSTQLRAAETKAAPERVGIYDSRLVAYAHSQTEEHQRKLRAQMEALKAAQAAGDAEKAKALQAWGREEQRRLHRQVFSTAPIDDVLAEIKDRLPELQKQAGVSKLISKWDEPGLKAHRQAQRVDVTELLVCEFNPGKKQAKDIAELRRKKPVPLEQADKLDNH